MYSAVRRQDDRHRRAFMLHALQPDLTAMGLDEPLDDGETQTGANLTA